MASFLLTSPKIPTGPMALMSGLVLCSTIHHFKDQIKRILINGSIKVDPQSAILVSRVNGLWT
jgi:hypothetical protein